mgnify:CR=1 FL=1|jgi:hypothetical protein
MAIAKSDAQVISMSVQGDGSVVVKVNIRLFESGKLDTRSIVDQTVTNATNDEKSAAASLVSKAAALAVG